MKNDVTVNGFSLPQHLTDDLFRRLQGALVKDDEEFAKALAVARAAGVKVISRKDRNNPIYVDKRTRQQIGGIELNKRLTRL